MEDIKKYQKDFNLRNKCAIINKQKEYNQQNKDRFRSQK